MNPNGVATRQAHDRAMTVTDVVAAGVNFICTHNSAGNSIFSEGLFANFSASHNFQKV